jgi:hypothetical protein
MKSGAIESEFQQRAQLGFRKVILCLSFFGSLSISTHALAEQLCRQLFQARSMTAPSAASSRDWMIELVQLRQEILDAQGPLRAALESEWRQRLSAISPDELAELRSVFQNQRTDSKSDEERAQVTRKQQQESLRPLRSMRLKAAVDGNFDFGSLRDGFSDDRFRYQEHEVEKLSGVQFGESGRFAMLRDISLGQDTIIVNMSTGESKALPGFGRLSSEGDLFFSHKDNGELEIHDLRNGKVHKTIGKLLPGRKFTHNRWFLSKKSEASRGFVYQLHDLSTGVLRTVELGWQISLDRDQKYLATEVDGQVRVYNLQTMDLVDHPLLKLKNVTARFGHEINSGLIKFEYTEELFGGWIKSIRNKIFSLYDMKIHDLDGDGLDWQVIPGTPLIQASNKNMGSPKMIVKSLLTGQRVEASHGEVPDVHHFKTTTMIRFHSNWVKESKIDGVLSIEPDRFKKRAHKVGGKLVAAKTTGKILFYDPETSEFRSFDIPRDLKPTIQFLDSSVLMRVFDSSTQSPTLFEFSPDGELLNSVESHHVGFSESGKFLAIERNGQLLFYESSGER